MRTGKNIVRHELIGLGCSVEEAENPSQRGIKGTIVNETQKTIMIETEKGQKRIPKKGTIFSLRLRGQKIKIKGDILLTRPEDRIKMKVKSW